MGIRDLGRVVNVGDEGGFGRRLVLGEETAAVGGVIEDALLGEFAGMAHARAVLVEPSLRTQTGGLDPPAE